MNGRLVERAREAVARQVRVVSGGATVTYARAARPGAATDPASYDPATGTFSQAAAGASAAEAFDIPAGLITLRAVRAGDGAAGFDRIALLPESVEVDGVPIALAPRVGDTITDADGAVFEVADVAPRRLGGAVCGHRASLRAGR